MTGSSPPPSLSVLRQLSSDASSEAFLAQVGGFDAPMVVRVVKPDLSQDAARMSQVMSEAERLTRLDSPALLRVRSTGRMNDGRVYVLTDFAEGEPLAGKPPLGIEALVELGEKLGEALKALHDSGLVHGALTAKHVLLTPHGPRLDASMAALSRAPGATAATDVHALATLLQAHAVTGGENNSFEGAMRRGMNDAKSATELLAAFKGMRQKWGGDTRVSDKKIGAGAEPDLTGQRIGVYDLKHVLGEGAMGRVYLGKHHRIGREAAVKVLKAEHARDRDHVQRFIQEATAVSAIKNEHIVEVHDFGEEIAANGTALVYCVMEVLNGRSLSDELKRAPMKVQRACRIMQQVARALGAAHALGVVHRDVKPENIFLHRRDGDSDYVKVLDFGVAKLLKPMGGLPTSSTQAGMIIGTPDYMAPEQALGSSTDLRVDLFAVGLVLYELLTGELPFRGENFVQLVLEITTKEPRPLPTHTVGGEVIPPRLAEIIGKCLKKRPDDRWNDAEELCAALEPFVHTGHTMEIPIVKLPPAAPPSRSMMGVALAAAVVILGGAGAFLWPKPVEGPAPLVVPPGPPVVVAPAPPPAPAVPTPPPPEPAAPPVVAAAPPPEPVRPTAQPLARLTGKDVARVFTKSATKIRKCLQDHRAVLPSKEGQLMLSFTVADSGAVSRANVTSPGFEGVVGNCVVSRLKDLRFPRNLEKEVTFELPLAYVFKD